MRATAFVVLAGCGLHPAPTSWTPLDTDALLAALDNPTATLAELQAEIDTLAVEVAAAEAGADVLEVVEPHLATEPIADPYDEPDADGEVHANNVFLRIACPGANANAGPDPEFTFGYTQIESPIVGDEAQVGIIQGDLLILARECLVGQSTTEADIRGVWDVPTGRLLGQGDIETRVPDVSEQLLVRVARLDLSEGARRFSVDIGDDEAYATASPTAVDGQYRFLLADGEALCTLEPQPACTPVGQ